MEDMNSAEGAPLVVILMLPLQKLWMIISFSVKYPNVNIYLRNLSVGILADRTNYTMKGIMQLLFSHIKKPLFILRFLKE